jgi:hypothetical protein
VDVDKLPPTQYLIGEVLAARHRIGEPFWHFPPSLGKPIGELVKAGLVEAEWRGDSRMHRVRFTDVGRRAWLSDTYDGPAGSVEVDLSKVGCPKCGSGNTTCRYRPEYRGCGQACHPALDERFERHCRGCSHEWTTFEVLG